MVLGRPSEEGLLEVSYFFTLARRDSWYRGKGFVYGLLRPVTEGK